MDLDNEKREFLLSQFAANAIAAAFQHAGVYRSVPPVSEKDHLRLHAALERRLLELGREYERAVSTEEHLSRIVALRDGLSAQFGSILSGCALRLGIAQKALNLYLKFLWCAGMIPTPPPDCTLDGIVIAELGESVAWTKMTDPQKYATLQRKAREKAGKDRSAAEWELELWNRKHQETMGA